MNLILILDVIPKFASALSDHMMMPMLLLLISDRFPVVPLYSIGRLILMFLYQCCVLKTDVATEFPPKAILLKLVDVSTRIRNLAVFARFLKAVYLFSASISVAVAVAPLHCLSQ